VLDIWPAACAKAIHYIRLLVFTSPGIRDGLSPCSSTYLLQHSQRRYPIGSPCHQSLYDKQNTFTAASPSLLSQCLPPPRSRGGDCPFTQGKLAHTRLVSNTIHPLQRWRKQGFRMVGPSFEEKGRMSVLKIARKAGLITTKGKVQSLGLILCLLLHIGD